MYDAGEKEKKKTMHACDLGSQGYHISILSGISWKDDNHYTEGLLNGLCLPNESRPITCGTSTEGFLYCFLNLCVNPTMILP